MRLSLALLALVLALSASVLAGGCGLIEPSGIKDIRCFVDRPMIFVKPRAANKQPVILLWEPKEQCWYWTWASATAREKAPRSFFEQGKNERDKWWIEYDQPKFGRNESAYWGLGAYVSSWRFSDGTWAGTGPPPIIKLQ